MEAATSPDVLTVDISCQCGVDHTYYFLMLALYLPTTLLRSNLATALRHRRLVLGKLKYELEEEIGCGIRPAVRPPHVRFSDKAPEQVLGLLFSTEPYPIL
jgi:hypothetical protein